MFFKRLSLMSEFERRVHYYKSGEISEGQWNTFRLDPIFDRYVKIRLGE